MLRTDVLSLAHTEKSAAHIILAARAVVIGAVNLTRKESDRVDYKNIAKAKAIEKQNKERLLKVNPKLNDRSGIYFLLREDENGFKYAYIGQSVGIITRLASHMSGYEQHIDKSLKAHKLYDKEKNPYGWRVEFLNFPESQLDEKEKYYIKLYADKGYQLRNVSLGGQGENRASGSIGERKAPKGYMQGIQQGRKNLARELSSIAEKHLRIELREDKVNNKVSQKQYEKFMDLLKVGENNQ